MLEEAEPEDATPWAIPQPTQPGPRRAVLVDHFPGPTRLTHPTVAFSSGQEKGTQLIIANEKSNLFGGNALRFF
jgi:hypothetical protein